MHRSRSVPDADTGALAYECGACGAISSEPADVVMGACRVCGKSAAEVDRELDAALAQVTDAGSTRAA